MCGIAGIFHRNGSRINSDHLKNMINALAHRGPDGSGIFEEGNIGLAHKRLSILDVSEKGAQPMSSSDGVWTVVFNGCIYNYKSIKYELIKRGVKFKSNSDTEVLVEGLANWGPELVYKLNGMFAFAAWNSKSSTLFLARDRYGVKPLYYFNNGSTLLFASEIKGIIKHPEYSIDVNFEALNEYFTFQNLFRFHTLFKDITLLPPANLVKITSSSNFVNHESYWDYDFTQPDESMDFEEARDETQRLLKQAVNRQLISDVPVGSYLSGGMDSGSITAIASKKIPRLSTFTCGFDLNEITGIESNYDERRDAELMASAFQTEHYEQVINSGDLAWSLPRVVYHLEDIRMGMSYPNYYISRLASKFVKVCLQGTGGDELFGGYPWRYYRVFDSVDKESFFKQYYNFWQRLVPDNEKKDLFTDNVTINDKWTISEVFKNVFLFNKNLNFQTPEDHIQNSLYFEIKTFLHGLLVMGDKLSMANGLEERFPFLDNDLVEFAQKIPIKHKLGNLERMKKIDEDIPRPTKKRIYQEYNDGKNVLRQAMKSNLPQIIIERKKQGFSAPDANWYRGSNSKLVMELLKGKKSLLTNFINPKYLDRTLYEHQNGLENHRLRIWSFLCFEWWCKIYLNGESFE